MPPFGRRRVQRTTSQGFVSQGEVGTRGGRVDSPLRGQREKLPVCQEKFLRVSEYGGGMREAAKNERVALLKSPAGAGDGGRNAGGIRKKSKNLWGDSQDGACQGGANMSFLQMRRRNLARERSEEWAAQDGSWQSRNVAALAPGSSPDEPFGSRERRKRKQAERQPRRAP